jgi:hypothetical protein
MVADDIRLRTRHELEEAGLSMEAASYLVDDRPAGGWESLVTKELFDARLAQLSADLRGEMRDALSKQTWRLAMLVVAAQAVVVAAIGGIVAASTG